MTTKKPNEFIIDDVLPMRKTPSEFAKGRQEILDWFKEVVNIAEDPMLRALANKWALQNQRILRLAVGIVDNDEHISFAIKECDVERLAQDGSIRLAIEQLNTDKWASPSPLLVTEGIFDALRMAEFIAGDRREAYIMPKETTVSFIGGTFTLKDNT